MAFAQDLTPEIFRVDTDREGAPDPLPGDPACALCSSVSGALGEATEVEVLTASAQKGQELLTQPQRGEAS